MSKLQAKLKTLSAEQIADLYRQVFCTEAGALILEDMKLSSFFYDITCPAGVTDRQGWINEGLRFSVMRIENAVKFGKKEIADV